MMSVVPYKRAETEKALQCEPVLQIQHNTVFIGVVRRFATSGAANDYAVFEFEICQLNSPPKNLNFSA